MVIFQKNNLNIAPHLTKTKMSLVIWLNIVTIVAQSVRLLPTCMREEVHATRQLRCQWWSSPLGLVSVMPNMQKMLLQFTTHLF